MANFSKAFNFRGGFQVDTDVLVVRGQNVGIGSTIPNERLVVDGIIQAEGLDISSQETVSISTAAVGFLTSNLIHVGITSISNGIITAVSPSAGVVTYYGDGGRLLNLPTSQWLDIDVGLGFTSIYAQGNVGVDTNDPRYVFQVGGVPYPQGGSIGLQTGVGIEDGNYFGSGDITIRGNVSAGQTVEAAQFVGMGSGITALNASNLGVGSIPSNIYGDEIYTGTVYGDLVGVAQSAASILTDADLEFDTALVRELNATQRVYTQNGRLQVGTDLGATIGDVDVRKTNNSTIYSLSDTATSRIFVGREREFSTNIEFGGLRYGGGVLTDPLSGANDLDIINYDIGNLNFYLHSGVSGVTSGGFRWIYGQSDRELMNLDRLGMLDLKGNLNTADPTLVVSGITSLTDDVTIGGGASIGGNSTLTGNLTIFGDLTLTGAIGITTDRLELPAADFSGDVIVNNDPSISQGVGLGTDGTVSCNRIEVYNGPTTSFTVTQSGAVDAQGIGCTGLDAEILVRSGDIIADRYFGQNGFFNDATGAGINTMQVDDLIVGEGNFTQINAGTADVTTVNTSILNIDGNAITSSGSTIFIAADVSFGSTIVTQPSVLTESINVGSGSTFATISNDITAGGNGDVGINTNFTVEGKLITSFFQPNNTEQTTVGFVTFTDQITPNGPAMELLVGYANTLTGDVEQYVGYIPMTFVGIFT